MTLCKVCSAATHPFTSLRFGTYDCCAACEFISKRAEDHVTEMEALETYSLHENTLEDPRYVSYFKAFIDAAVEPFTPSKAHGFDFGSGPQPVLASVLSRDYGYPMSHYDYFFSPEKTYIDKKFGLITATEVVEHIEDPISLFEFFKEHLEEHGILAIMTTFHPNNLDRFNNWHYMRDKTHISFFTPATLRYIAKRVGLKELYTDNRRYMTFALEAP